MQWIDGRDLGAFIVHAVEARAVGTMNALGPSPGAPMRSASTRATAPRAGARSRCGSPPDFLKAHAVQGWADMPMWLDARGDDAG